MLWEVGLPVVIAATAMVMDLRTAKVDNGWIVFSLCVGLVYRLAKNGPSGLSVCMEGILLPLLLLGWLFFFRMLGAGDIKLFCALGSMLGMEKILSCIFYSLIIGAGLSIIILLSDGIFLERFLYFFHYLQDVFVAGERKPYRRSGITNLENFHFTVPIFLSVLLYAGGVY